MGKFAVVAVPVVKHMFSDRFGLSVLNGYYPGFSDTARQTTNRNFRRLGLTPPIWSPQHPGHPKSVCDSHASGDRDAVGEVDSLSLPEARGCL